jgi:glyoxylase-like metal-dependent hydrolase (beta-lactamase superfamily II)
VVNTLESYSPPVILFCDDMSSREVAPGVEGIGFGYVRAFVVIAQTLVLVDSGIPKKATKLRGVLSQAGQGKLLSDVLITHHHVDHVGSLAEIAPEGVTVWAHPLDAKVVRGEVPAPRPESRSAFDRFGVAVIERVGPKAAPARVDREISDGEQIPVGDGFVAYHTPGHTAGHMSFLYPSKRLLFVGDAAANMLGRLGSPFGLYSEDHEAVRSSIAKLAALDFDVACFGHGRVLKGAASAKFRTLAERLAG